MPPKRRGKTFNIGGSIIHIERPVLALIIALVVVLGLFISARIVWSQFFAEDNTVNPAEISSEFTYPFETNDETMRTKFLEDARPVEDGRVLSVDPRNQYFPGVVGGNYQFTVFFPEDSFANSNPVRFTYDDFNMTFYPAVIVPHEPRQALEIIEQYGQAVAAGQPDAIYNASATNPFAFRTVMLGFSNESDVPSPSDGEYFADILGTYYWTNKNMDANFSSSVAELPTILVGDWNTVGYAQITEPTNARLPIDQTVQRTDLRIGVIEAEFATGQTRIKLAVDNFSGGPKQWGIQEASTYIVADDQTRRLIVTDDQQEQSASPQVSEFIGNRRLNAEELQPRINEGYLIFDGGGIPKNMTIHLTDPGGKGQLVMEVDMSKLVSNQAKKAEAGE